jgi:hypothetical protein
VRNNPINFNDPTGHLPAGECGFWGEECGWGEDYPSDYFEPQDDDDNEIMDDSDDAQLFDFPLAIDLRHNYSIIIMPIEYPPSPNNLTAEQLELAQFQTEWGITLDMAELIAILVQLDSVVFDYGLSGADVIVTFFSCVNMGECYYGQPHPDLPEMLVVNQDVLLTTSDLVIPLAAGLIAAVPTGGVGFIPGSQIVDAYTTTASMIYDTTRWTGDTPNYISFGVDSSLNLNLIIYP